MNTDIEPKVDEIYLDATQQYPFPDQSFHYIFSEHVIEHVPWEAGINMLKECCRVLAPGGKLRVVTPDLARFVKLLVESIDAGSQQFVAAKPIASLAEDSCIPRLHIQPARFAIGGISSFMTRRRSAKVSNLRISSRLTNTAWKIKPIQCSAKLSGGRETRARIFGRKPMGSDGVRGDTMNSLPNL